VFLPGDGREISGDEMHKLCRTLSGLEDALVALERRGVSLRDHAARRDKASGKLPMYHVFYGAEEHWFTSRDALEAFMKGKQQSAGGERRGRPAVGVGRSPRGAEHQLRPPVARDDGLRDRGAPAAGSHRP
jgi:hypothetical protein